MQTERQPQGEIQGKDVHSFHIENQRGTILELSEYGASLMDFQILDSADKRISILLGMENLQGYQNQNYSLGATVGPLANRLSKGTFNIEGETYQLPCNDGKHNLHSYPKGLQNRVWKGELIQKDHSASVRFQFEAEHGDGGFPGNRVFQVEIGLDEEDNLDFHYRVESDRPTPVNLTNHGYWDLSGERQGIGHEELQIFAEQWIELDLEKIPTGRMLSVQGRPMNFQQPRLSCGDPRSPMSYDHCWALEGHGFRRAARLNDSRSGLAMEVWTDAPGLQYFNCAGMEVFPLRRTTAGPFKGLCLETQYFPDTPNHRDFPQSIARPGSPWESRTQHRFFKGGEL